MLKILSLLTVIVSAAFGNLYAEYFTIQSYDVKATMNADSSIQMEEKIKVVFQEPRHGIYRFIPYLYKIDRGEGAGVREMPSLLGDRFDTLIYDVSVPGYQKSISRQNGNLMIRIGSKDVFVDGEQDYTISYKVYGEIGRFSDHEEFYYNLIGNKWGVPILHTSFKIALPAEVVLRYDDVKFFTGSHGSTEDDVRYEATTRDISGKVTRELDPYEGLTVAVKFPKGYFGRSTLLEAWLWFINNSYLFILPIVLLIAFLTWWFKGRDKKSIDMVHFNPPEGVTPAEAGVIIDDIADNRDLLSLIFYWAVNGNLEIEESEKQSGFVKDKDYILIKKKDLPKNARQFEKTMFDGLFSHFAEDGKVEISSLKETFYTYFNQAKSELDAFIDLQSWYEPGSRALRGFFIFLAAAFAGGGIFLFAAMDMSPWFMVSMLLCAPVWFIFGWIMPKKTDKGLEQYKVLRGFKQFIDRAEKPKLETMLRQDPDYFDKTLPFAIALGSGDKWAKKFNGIIKEPPSWYRGSTMRNFTTLYFLSSLNSSMSAMGNAMTSMPSKSSSGGFGGGGFSGGGGGGGGGGSW